MSRHVLTVNLKDDQAIIDTYREYHRRVWPEVLNSLRQVGVERMDIHLLGRQLVMSVELANGVDVAHAFAAHRASNPRVAEWERLMQSMQEPPPQAARGEWWAIMEPIFRFEDQEPAIEHRVERSVIS